MNDSPPLRPAGPVLSIGGRVERPLSFDLAALREYESVMLEPFDLSCFTSGRFIRTVDQTDLDDPAGAAEGRAVFELRPIR